MNLALSKMCPKAITFEWKAEDHNEITTHMNTFAELPLVPQRTHVEWSITGMANLTDDKMPCFHKNLDQTWGKLKRFWRFSFAGFVFCSTEWFVFAAQGLTGQQSALLSGLQSRLVVVVVDALALGFNPRGWTWALQLLITVQWKCWDCFMSPGKVKRDSLPTTC